MQPVRRRRRRRWGPRIALLLGLLFAAGVVGSLLALADRADQHRVPLGMTVAKIDVGGLSRAEAIRRVRQRYARPAMRAVRVDLAGRSHRLGAARAGVEMDIRGAVDRAIAAGRRDDIVTRAWRSLTNGRIEGDVPVPIAVDTGRVRRFVARLGDAVARPAVDAALQVAVVQVSVTRSHAGRRLDAPAALTARIVRALRDAYSRRTLAAGTAPVAPVLTKAGVWRAHRMTVTVSQHQKVVRVFRRGHLVKRYRVAVGTKQYPTPYGTFSVQTMQRNPPWNVPHSEWAGGLAGKTIPGGAPGNPLVARWIGFDGSVGFHGTREALSIGHAASHGCVRMRPSDVIDLYKRVGVGTTVLVGV
jgi:lipoprotein-anchoring transpeptidase ErfK/SrfK